MHDQDQNFKPIKWLSPINNGDKIRTPQSFDVFHWPEKMYDASIISEIPSNCREKSNIQGEKKEQRHILFSLLI